MKTTLKYINKIVAIFLLGLVVFSVNGQQNNTVSVTYLYDKNGNQLLDGGMPVTVESRTYFDKKGRLLQSQSRLNSLDIILATQPLYDRFGRSVISSLPAPIGASGTSFGYKNNFFMRTESIPYSFSHFDLEVTSGNSLGEVFNPEEVNGRNLAYTLGWYYSDANTLEEVPVTKYPYTRVAFKDDGSNEVSFTTLPGDQHKLGQGHEVFSEIRPITDELEEYLELRQLFVSMDELIKAQAIQQNHIAVPTSRNDVLTANETVYVAPTGSLELTDGFDTNGYEFEVINTNVAYYINLKEQATYQYSRDPNGKESHVFADGNGNTIASAYSSISAPTLKGWSYNIYDDAGRLLVSVTPNGVEQWRDGEDIASIDKTTYEYNHRGWLLSMTEPDAGTTNYLYRHDGKIRFSQNAKQKSLSTMGASVFSFTNYDEYGRPIGSGEYEGTLDFDNDLTAILETTGIDGGLNLTPTNFRDWNTTSYDLAAANLQVMTGLAGVYSQDFLMGAVSYSENENMYTWYSYDDVGQVTWMLQKPRQAGLDKVFATKYVYDYNGSLLENHFKVYASGSVNPEQTFIHKYTYDKDLRMTKAETSEDDGITWVVQAEYEYFLHGPLKRVIIAEDLQGIDYRYTVQGWLKSINHPEDGNDPGMDGTANGLSNKDAFGMTLEYFDGDYALNFSGDQSISTGAVSEQLFDGNISAISWKTPLNKWQSGVNAGAYAFNYDNRYQLLDAHFGSADFSTQTYSADPSNVLKVSGLDYDANGNILQLKRHGVSGALDNDFTYSYQQNKNKLNSVSNYASYTYNAIGQMVGEDKAGDNDQYLDYDVSGKVTHVYSDVTKSNLKVSFDYDDRGFRLIKTVSQPSGPDYVTWYIRDASGALLATYDNRNTDGTYNSTSDLKELVVYGSGKIGTLYPEKSETLYELTDHLGNVRATVAESNPVTYGPATFEDGLWPGEQEEGFDLNTAVRVGDGPSNKSAKVLAGDGNVIGPSHMLMVMPGDQVQVTVKARLESGSTSVNAPVSLLGSIISGLTGGGAISEAMTTSVQNGVTTQSIAALSTNLSANEAHVNWLFFDNNFEFVDGDSEPVTGTTSMASMTVNIDALKLDRPGFLYIYTSNESSVNAEAYFDDLKIVHTQGIVRSTADYYPFGSQITERSFSSISPNDYRFGYQGQFAEKDQETGWNSFELRMLNPIVGRWLSVDPKRQHSSSYLGMSNNPIRRVDPDGGDDWYTDADGNLRYSESVKNQADVDARGGGKYVGEWFFDGENEYLPGGWIFNMETGTSLQLNFIPNFTEPLFTRSDIPGYDYEKAVKFATNQAASTPQGQCGRYCRLALMEGGLKIKWPWPGSAKGYSTFLPKFGFKEVPTTNYQPMKGDIVVMQAIGTHIHGHIQIYNGEKWVSDYIQPRFYPYISSRPKFQIFR